MDKKRLLELLIKKRAGSISSTELQELEMVQEEGVCNKELSDTLDSFFNTRFAFDEANKDTIDHSWGIIDKKIKVRSRTYVINKKMVFAIAASILALVVLTVLLISQSKMRGSKENIVFTQKGRRLTVTLPDGTRVWLNNDTKLIYARSFDKANRVVHLSGEAYFDVVKDKNHPFIIHTKTFDIKVLGTVFNVRAYPDDPVAQTSLISGKVAIHLKDHADTTIFLSPNEKATLTNDPVKAGDKTQEKLPQVVLSPLKKLDADSSIAETGWLKNRLVFQEEPLDDIVTELERWYGVQITLENKPLRKKKISGIFENKSIAEVIEALQLVTGFKYTINGSHITIL